MCVSQLEVVHPRCTWPGHLALVGHNEKKRESDIKKCAPQAWQGGYALQILLVGILVFTVLTSCPGGLVFTAVALLAWLIIWMVLSVLILGTMVVLADLCAHAERIIIDEVRAR
eukprot:scaffold89496_cov19-Tisochrysis_lutea.AAC.3